MLGRSYSWDDRVPHCHELGKGDLIVLWDSKHALGVSVIENIERARRSKRLLRCPACRRTDVRDRVSKSPRYRCGKCRSEFEEPKTESVTVDSFSADYSPSWTPIHHLNAEDCRALTQAHRSQQSIRPIKPELLRELILNLPRRSVSLLADRSGNIRGGHRQTIVRARLGQAAFRRSLESTFGCTCALTGSAPAKSLHAAHLYRYSDVGEHHEHGGLLVRADLHPLFDSGLITIDPDSGRIKCAAELLAYPALQELHGQLTKVPLAPGHRAWLRLHWQQWNTD